MGKKNKKPDRTGEVFVVTQRLAAFKLQTEYLAKLSPERSAKEWEDYFLIEATKLLCDLPVHQWNAYLNDKLPNQIAKPTFPSQNG